MKEIELLKGRTLSAELWTDNSVLALLNIRNLDIPKQIKREIVAYGQSMFQHIDADSSCTSYMFGGGDWNFNAPGEEV